MATNNVPDAKPTVQLDAAVLGASVQLPAFDKVEPHAWFAVADANFALRKVTDQMTKYYYVLSKLDANTLRKLSAFLQEERGSDPYDEVRSTLCQTFEPPMEQKLDALLATNDMGDERPMQFGLELLRLLGPATAHDILKRIFLRSIPPTIVTAITGSLSASYRDVLSAADKAWTSASSAPQSTAAVATISGQPSVSRRGGRGGRQRGGRSASLLKSVVLCVFHQKFGNAAKKCTPGCSRWTENRPRDAQSAQVFRVEEDLDGEDTQDAVSGNE